MRKDKSMSRHPVEETYTMPRADLVETPQHYLVLMDLPGVPKEGLNIKVREGVLTVVATPDRPAAQGDRLLYGEVDHGTFQRNICLSEKEVDIDKVTAHLENGVLSMTLPKREERKARRIPVRRIQ
ncbi:Hsp20/alpha crystallin family protein [Candidatus Zixiibacteriota bacterium]